MRISPGHITAILTSAFAVALLSAVAYPIFESPQPASAALASATVVTHPAHDSTSVVLSEKTSLLTYTARTEQKERQAAIAAARARHRRHEAWLRAQRAAAVTQAAVSYTAPAAGSYPTGAGDFSYSQLEALWSGAGGPDPATAACIAEHESSGNPNADNGAGDIGLWQVAQAHDPGGNLMNPYTNARVAVAVYRAANGWGPWTTAPDCGV